MTTKKIDLNPNQAVNQPSRRKFLKDTSLAIAMASAGTAVKAEASEQTPSAPARPTASPSENGQNKLFYVVETTTGKVQGISNVGIKQFKGIPYGAPTNGKNRFMPPKPPAPWTGVRECFGHGQISPQRPSNLRGDYGMMIMWDQQPGGMGEDCLSLNVWTPGVNDGAKRPVLVSFHGGGFSTGSGNAIGFDGAHLALFGDVVVVTVNHRLASFGYTHLADLGAPPEFAHAGVAGIMDLVASLRWVHDNIGNFGGDANRVMIFGQSGGGAKTSTILATPSAKGLFHRAAVQSGSTIRLGTRETGTRTAEALLAKLNIPKGRLTDLQKVSWQELLEAQTGIAGFAPVVDGTIIPHHPFDPVAPAESADVPVIISTTLEDAALSLTNFNLDEAGLKALLNERYSGKGDEILALYRKHYPQKAPFLIQAQAFTDAGFRRSAITQAERKAALGKAPVYMYLWNWESPSFGGKFGAVHGIDVAASFHHVRSTIMGVGSPVGKVMCDRLASVWVNFAKTGDPNNPRIPHWPAYHTDTRATMVFDTDTRVENDPRGEIRKFWVQNPPTSARRG
jgi:para-nitrobenzyl esterase